MAVLVNEFVIIAFAWWPCLRTTTVLTLGKMNHAYVAPTLAPWLKALSAPAWEKFVDEFNAYKARGGEIELCCVVWVY